MLRQIFLSLLTVAALGLLPGCASRGGPVPYDVSNFVAPDTDRPNIGNEGIIGKLDKVSVAVFELPELDRDMQVDTNGNVQMPLIGSVRAEGFTTEQLAQQISEQLAARYIRSPSVQVTIKEAVTKVVTVGGAVKSPGVFPVRGETNLLSVIALAAGPAESANPSRVVVFRQIAGERRAAAFDLKQIQTGRAPNPVIYGNDSVIIDGSRLDKAYRDILQAVPLLYFTRVF